MITGWIEEGVRIAWRIEEGGKDSRADRRKYIYKLEWYLMYLIEIDKSGAYIGFQPGGASLKMLLFYIKSTKCPLCSPL